MLHRVAGYGAIILAIPTIVLGTQIIAKSGEFQSAYGGAWAAIGALAIALAVTGKRAGANLLFGQPVTGAMVAKAGVDDSRL